MKLLLKKVTILDTNSSHNGTVKDILIKNGIIESILDSIIDTDATVIDQPNTYVSTGFIDCFADFADPGYEYKETLQSGANAALHGGYTSVMVLPNTIPCTENKTGVEYILHEAKNLPIQIYPIGAITHKTEGQKLTEMMEMQQVGAVAFSDGWQSLQNANLFLKALLYVKAFNGTVIDIPYDAALSSNGYMHEGIFSTQLGLLGIPAIAEEMMVARNIALCEYAKSKLHITGISTAKSVALIRDAKAKGIGITCSVTPYHLLLTDNSIAIYNTNAKVLNPLRTKQDVEALQEGVLDGTIDCVASHHRPQDNDSKVCEFANAAFGMSTIEYTFNALASIKNCNAELVTKVLGENVARIFNLPSSKIEKEEKVNLTVFTMAADTVIDTSNCKSKSKNTAFDGMQLKGKIIAAINGNNKYLAS